MVISTTLEETMTTVFLLLVGISLALLLLDLVILLKARKKLATGSKEAALHLTIISPS